MDILILIGISIWVFFPILLWGYMFSYINNNPFNAKLFLYGLFAGMISGGIILLTHDIWNQNTLLQLTGTGWVLLVSAIILTLIISKHKQRNIHYIFQHVSVVLFLILLFYILTKTVSLPIDSLYSSIFVYIGIAYSEELSKHIHFVSTQKEKPSIKQWVLMAIFVALGFSFLENIIYLYQDPNLATYIARSIFTVLVHIAAISISAFAFMKYLYGKSFIFTVPIGLLLSILVHAIFDTSLALGYTWIVMVYFVAIYFILGKFFHLKE